MKGMARLTEAPRITMRMTYRMVRTTEKTITHMVTGMTMTCRVSREALNPGI